MLRRTSKLFLLGLVLVSTISFGFAYKLYFSPSLVRPILNCSSLPVLINLNTEGAAISSYGADVWKENSKLWFVGGALFTLDSPFVLDRPTVAYNIATNTRGTSPVYYVWDYQGHHGTPGQYATFSGKIGDFTMTNTGYYFVTGATLRFLTGSSAQTFANPSAGRYDLLDADITTLGMEFWGAPCIADVTKPVINIYNTTSYGANTFPLSNINRQNKDTFSYLYDLLDTISSNNGTQYNFWSGSPNWYAGDNFYPNVEAGNTHITNQANNQNGVDSGTFILQFIITSGWDNYTYDAQNIYTYIRSSDGISLNATGRTWRWDDRNFTGQLDKTYLSGYGIEEKITISGYVEDRNSTDIGTTWPMGTPHIGAANRTSFVFSFNQGMRPWFNTGTQGSFTHTPTCAFALEIIQTGLIVTEISGYLHDDWAGIDTGSVKVRFSGMVNNSPSSVEYDVYGGVFTLTSFTFTTNGCRNENLTNGNCATAYDPINCVCNTGSLLTTGFTMLVTNSQVFDPEDPIAVSIDYSDAKAKTGRTVNCSWSVSKAPRIVNTGGYTNTFNNTHFASLISLSNYPQGAQISLLSVQMQDDWAGVDSGTTNFLLSGVTLNGTLDNVVPASVAFTTTTNTNVFIYNPALWDNLGGYPAYNDWLGTLINTISSRQQRNYQIDFAQTVSADSSFTGYFGPEYPITFALTFNDLDGTVVSNPIAVSYTNNEAPEFRDYTGSVQLTNDDAALGNYLTGGMAEIFSGSSNERRIFPYSGSGTSTSVSSTEIAFETTDNWAGVDSGTIRVTLSGTRWGQISSYEFTMSGMEWDINGNLVLSTGDKKIVLASFDRGDVGGWNLLNYLSEITDHNIYFDRQVWDDFNNEPLAGKESRYSIQLFAADLKQPTPNTTTVTYTRDMENLQCKYLDRCNADLYFTYKYDGTVIEPVSNNTGVHPFNGTTVYVVGVTGTNVIGTGIGQYYINCAGSSVLSSPIALTWSIPVINAIPPSTSYQQSTMLITDGQFELSGNVLVLK